MSKIVLLLILASSLANCADVTYEQTQGASSANPSAAVPDTPEASQYAVYDALLRHLISDSPDAVYAVEERTSSGVYNPPTPGSLSKYLAEKFPDLSRDVINDFVAKNEVPSLLRALFQVKVVLLSPKELKELFAEQKLWEHLRERYHSHGLVTFSKVGFNRELNRAVVYVGHQRHKTDGVGRYVSLMKEDGSWKVQGKVDVWHS